MDKVIGNYGGQADNSFPLDCGTLEALQTNTMLVELLGNIAGDKIILSGCEPSSGGSHRSEGYVFLRTRDYPMGEILRWEGGKTFAGMRIAVQDVQITTKGNVYPKAYSRRYLEPGSGGEHFEWADFHEPYKNSLFKIKQLLTEDEQAQVRDNIGAVSAEVVNKLSAGLNGIDAYTEVLYSFITKLFKDKQDKLIDGVSIKTINGVSMLGEGDVQLPAGGEGSGDVDLSAYLTKSLAKVEYVQKNDVGLYDVDRYNPAASDVIFHTPRSARNTVPDEARRQGLTITYRTADGVHVVERFVGSGELDLTTERDWLNNNYWLREFPYVINAHDFKTLADGECFETLEEAINWIPECHRRPGVIFTCQTTNGKWLFKRFIGASADEWFYTSSKWVDVDTVRRNVNVIVAAFDSSEEDKRYADVVAPAEDKGYNVIRYALGLLGADGGKITLMNGTYRGAIIDGETENASLADIIYLNKEGIIIEGMGRSTVITTDSTVADANIQVSKEGCVLRDLSLSLPLRNNSNYDVRLENVYIAGERNDAFADKSKVMEMMTVKPSEGIAGINAAIKSLSATGGKIYLESGTYSGTSGVALYVSNITIEGQGPTTIISREGSTNTVFVQGAYADTLKNVVLRDLTIAQGGTFVTKEFTEKPVKLINCWVNGQYYYQSQETTANIITVGKGMDFDTVYKAYISIDSTKPLPSEFNRYEIHVYGHIKEEKGKRLYLNRQYVDIIGHNAIIEYEDDDPVGESAYPCAVILDNAVTNPDVAHLYGNYNHSTYRDLHFLRTGTVNAWNFPCVHLSSDYVTLINCVFENRTKSATDFIPSNTPSGGDDKAGARRHGIVISCNNFDDECKTRLINCVGIGSPYGFMNTRGIYIGYGGPSLYNCVGYGGGMGERSHGIISHRYSKAKLFNCIGYGSKYTIPESNGECCGIRFQSMTQSECHNCIGYAGTSDKSSGISVWHKSQPKLINCTGYGGKGKESVGLDIADYANPTVLGGFYGVANNAMAVTFVKNTGNRMTFTLVEDAPCVIKQCVTWLTTSNMTEANVPVGTTFSLLRADGSVIIDKSEVNFKMSAISYPEISEVTIQPGEKLTVLWQDANGNEIAVEDDTLKLQFVYQYSADGGHGLRLLRYSKGVMRDVTFESNINGYGVIIDTVNNTSEMDRCTIIGNNGVAINSMRANLDNVNIGNSSIKGEIVNINSFKEVEVIGGNNCKI
ncbi:MAG: hypothetical protein IJY31_03360 [Muribaculaceae bacterium]|nr:hypothetical protein [Muribaculaceae bacterium]